MFMNNKKKGSIVLFYELLQVALGKKEMLSRIPSDKEWTELFLISQKQAVVGVALQGIEKLNQHGQKPPLTLLLEWIGQSEQIRVQNKILNQRCGEIVKHFADAGFRSCILKGQGNGRMYPDPLLRTCGDIDIWLEGDKEKIKKYVLSLFPYAEDTEMHIEFPIFDNVPVEVHYKPRYSRVPRYEERLQKWFKDQSNEQFLHRACLDGGSEVCIPTTKFNAVHQLSHMMGHFFYEGIGIRHLIDYYYVLKELQKEGVKEDFATLFSSLGMLSFATGIMWIEKSVLGLDEESLIVPASERRGKIILEGVEDGGNFGVYRQDKEARQRSVLLRGLIDANRLLKLFSVQPSEVFYRMKHKLGNVDSMKEALRVSELGLK